ncbi:MAG: tyrosine-type recombinase/integrase [Candidatus Korobacteraceae bacterium]
MHRSKVIGRADQLSKDAAERILDSWLRPLNDGAQPIEMIDFATFYKRWEDELLPTYRDSTRKFYHDTVKGYIYPHFKDALLTDIRPLDVQAFINSFARTYSRSVMKHIRAALNSLFSTAVTWRYLKENPAKGLRLPPGKPVARAQVLTPSQIGSLVKTLLSPYREMVLLAAVTGLRPSELWGLRWTDVDGDGVHVRQRLYRRHVGDTKTPQSARTIPVAAVVLAELNRRRGQSDELVFHGPSGGPIRSDEVLHKHILPVAQKLDLPAFTWRSFRRSAESLMHENGVSLKAQSAMLGHTNVNTTMLYAETNEGAKRAAAEVLSSLFCLNLAQEASRAM